MTQIKLTLSRNELTGKFMAEVNVGPAKVIFNNTDRLVVFKSACDFIQDQLLLAIQLDNNPNWKPTRPDKLALNSAYGKFGRYVSLINAVELQQEDANYEDDPKTLHPDQTDLFSDL